MLLIGDFDSLCYGHCFANEQNGEVKRNGELFMRKGLDESIKAMIKDTGGTDYKVFLTGKNNFRDKVSPTYKANRANMKRPVLLPKARQHLVDEHYATISDGLEADDLVCIEMTECNDMGVPCVLAGIDKDLMQCPGLHYRWPLKGKDSVFTEVNEHDGWVNLYTQSLLGDKVDNIMQYYDGKSHTWKKDYGLGAKGAEKALYNCKTEAEFQQAVLDVYATLTKRSDGSIPTEEDFKVNMDLLYLLRSQDDGWDFLL